MSTVETVEVEIGVMEKNLKDTRVKLEALKKIKNPSKYEAKKKERITAIRWYEDDWKMVSDKAWAEHKTFSELVRELVLGEK